MPGARFDPFGPIDPFNNTHRPNPNPDHLPPPGEYFKFKRINDIIFKPTNHNDQYSSFDLVNRLRRHVHVDVLTMSMCIN